MKYILALNNSSTHIKLYTHIHFLTKKICGIATQRNFIQQYIFLPFSEQCLTVIEILLRCTLRMKIVRTRLPIPFVLLYEQQMFVKYMF